MRKMFRVTAKKVFPGWLHILPIALQKPNIGGILLIKGSYRLGDVVSGVDIFSGRDWVV